MKSNNKDRDWDHLVNLQKGLLIHYISIEKIPMYPLENLEDKKHQKLVRSLMDRLVEELIEALEKRTRILETANGEPDADSRKSQIKEYQNGFHKEIGDTLHFLIEILLYLDLEKVLPTSYQEWCREDGQIVPWDNEKTILENIFGISKSVVQLNYADDIWNTVVLLPHEELIAGLRIGGNYDILIERIILRVIYHLQLSKNALKNRDWRKGKTDILESKNLLLRAIQYYFYLLVLFDYKFTDVIAIYENVNLENHSRIQTNNNESTQTPFS